MASRVPKKEKKVSTLERYYPSQEEIKQTFPENLNELFEKYGDDLIFQDDPNGKGEHIFYLQKKLYKCIKKNCKAELIVEEEKIREETKTQKGKKGKEKAEEDPKDKEKEDVKQEEKGVQGAIPKKKRKPRKKNKKGKNKNPNGQVNPKEEPGKPEEKEK